MNNFSPELFGRSFGEITLDYINGIGKFISPIFHLITLVILILVIFKGNKSLKYFTVYYLSNYIWIFLFVGLYISFLLHQKMGISFLVFWGPVPFLLLWIFLNWVRELRVKQNNLILKNISKIRFVVLPVIIFGFWYPYYTWGIGFTFSLKDLIFSSYGLMPCPTTMVVLGLLTLKYPDVNKGLFYSLTLFSIMVGSAQFAIGYVPDYPLAILGYYCLILILLERKNRFKTVKH